MTTSYGLRMLVIALGLAVAPGQASAGKFNSLIPNPFAFCSAPRPCKICHPWRAIWKEICADQKGAGQGGRETPPVATPIVSTVDEDGKRSYTRTVDGWTIQSSNRFDLEDANLNAEQPGEGIQVIDGPINEAHLRLNVQ